MKAVVLSVVLLLAAVLAMAFRVLLVRGGRFPEGHGRGCRTPKRR